MEGEEWQWHWLAHRFGMLDVDKAKERITSRAFMRWMAFFKGDKPGGPRTPEEERQDVRAAALYALTINCHLNEKGFPVSAEDFLMFPVERKVEDKMANALLIMNTFAEVHNGNYR